MNNNELYSASPYDSEMSIPEGFRWLWESDESETRKKKKKSKKKKQMKKMKKMEETLQCLLKEQKRAKKKHKKKAQKQLQREFMYRLIERSADTTLCTISDVTKMYAQSKFSPSGSNK